MLQGRPIFARTARGASSRRLRYQQDRSIASQGRDRCADDPALRLPCQFSCTGQFEDMRKAKRGNSLGVSQTGVISPRVRRGFCPLPKCVPQTGQGHAKVYTTF